MRRLLPHPLLAFVLLLLWLMLQQSAAPGHIVMGALIGIGVSLASRSVLPPTVVPKRPLLLIRLVFVAGADIVRSNIAVLLILLQRRPEPKAGFIEMPLALKNDFALAILACLLTATPGSAWLQYYRERGVVLIHVLDLVDPDDWVKTIKNRYETLLMEIFE